MREREREREHTSGGHSSSSAGPMRRSKKKICRFCADFMMPIDYKEPKFLGVFVTERGKIIPRRVTGNCAFHQRRIQEAVKRARILAFLPFTNIYQG